MPTPMLKSLVDKSDKSLKDAERYWDEAKEQAKNQGLKEDSDDFYSYVVGIVKKRLGLTSSTSSITKVANFINRTNIHQELINHYTSKKTSSINKHASMLQAAPVNFFKDLSKKLKKTEILKLFKNSQMVEFFHSIKWSFEKLYDLLKQGKKHAKSLSLVIKEYAEKNKVVKWTTKELGKLDDFLQDHPNTKKIVGVSIAAILLFLWFNKGMSKEISIDFASVLGALKGSFTLKNLFGGANGLKLLSIFATGAILGLVFPWPKPTSVKFIISILSTLSKKLNLKTAFLIS